MVVKWIRKITEIEFRKDGTTHLKEFGEEIESTDRV
jgi:hypothetical protein